MRVLPIAVLALLCLAMGGKRPELPGADTTVTGATAAVDPFYQRFKELSRTYGAAFAASSVSFSFRSFFGSTVGLCRFSSSGRNSVELSSSAWSAGSDTFREMLLFHELGHCLLGRGHKNSTHGDGRPESLMNSWLFNQRTYAANRDAYLKELFTAENNAGTGLAARSRHMGDCGWAPFSHRGW